MRMKHETWIGLSECGPKLEPNGVSMYASKMDV